MDASAAYLAARLCVVESRVAALVAIRRAGDPDPDDRFRGLYVSDAQAAAILQGPLPSLVAGRAPGDPETAAALAAAEAAADTADAGGTTIRLRSLARDFELTPLDVELLLVALATDLDPRFERLYGYLNDDVSRRRASVGLALRLSGAELASHQARLRLAPSSPLVAGGLLIVGDRERPFLSRSLDVPDRVAAHLLGDDGPDPALAPYVRDAPDAGGAIAGQGAAALSRALRAGAHLAYLRDGIGSAATELAVRGLAGAALAAVVLDLTTLSAADDAPQLAAAATREARLRGAGLVAGPIEPLADLGARVVRAFADAACPVVLVGSRAWDPSWSRGVPLAIDATAVSPADRAAAWRAALARAAAPARTADEITAYPFRVGPAAIERAAETARVAAAAAGRPIEVGDLAAGVRAQNTVGLERLARRIAPAAAWDDLVLPPDQLDQLRELVARARYRDAVLDGWGLGDPNRGRGLTALFTGDSGTGKTLSAKVVAGDLGLDLYVIDLSSVVDKYIGETEKNLDKVFNQADGVNGVLLFDEADAIFGKRSEVRDARDRYANVEIAYLLQRMERFDGVAILTTNLRANLDEAFTRRLDVLVDFPMPDEAERLRLWRRHLPGSLPTADDLDLDFLSSRFRISGGNIRNIVATAAYRAAAGGRAVSMADLVRGTAREYQKLGHLATEAEFGPYLALLAAGASSEGVHG